MKVIIDYSALTKQGNTIIDCSSDFKNQTKLLLDKIDELKSNWSGQAASSYMTTMKDKIIKELDQIYPYIEDYGEYAKNVATAYQILDNNYSNKRITIK